MFAKWQEKVDNLESNEALLRDAGDPVGRYWDEDLDSLASLVTEREEERAAREKEEREKRHGGIHLTGESIESMEGEIEDGLDPGLELWESQVTYEGSSSETLEGQSPSSPSRIMAAGSASSNEGNDRHGSREGRGKSKFSKLGKFLTSSQWSEKRDRILHKHSTTTSPKDDSGNSNGKSKSNNTGNKIEMKSGGTGTGNPKKNKFRHRTHQTLTKDLVKLIDSKAIMKKVEETIEYGFKGSNQTHLV